MLLSLALALSSSAHADPVAFCDHAPIEMVRDADSDGEYSLSRWYCAPNLPPRAAGWVDINTVTVGDRDCNDRNAAVNHSAVEVSADGLDNDCDRVVDEVEVVDADGDGSEAGVDCDDADALTFPGATEVCDAVDNDCDLVIDEDTADDDADGTCDELDVCTGDWSLEDELDTSKVEFPGITIYGESDLSSCDGGVTTLSACKDDPSSSLPSSGDFASYVTSTAILFDDLAVECSVSIVTELTSSNPDCTQVSVQWGCL